MQVGIRAAVAAVAFAVCGLTVCDASAATLKPIYSFCPDQGECADGNAPVTLAQDQDGNLYGATLGGGIDDNGTIFSLTHDTARTKWTFHLLYSFCPGTTCTDGRQPQGSLVVGTDGTIYGTTMSGGNAVNDGVAFALTPNKTHTKYKYSVIYTFCQQTRCPDGSLPSGGLTYFGAQNRALFDKKTPLYGLAGSGGANQSGVAYQLTVSKSGTWTEKVIHDFCSGSCFDGGTPIGKLQFTSPTTMIGVSFSGGAKFGGAAYELTSNAKGTKWKSKGLFDFDGNSPNQTGSSPSDGMIMGSDGSLYGTTTNGSANLRGVLYKLTPNGKSDAETVLYAFCQNGNPNCTDGAVPGGLVPVMDTSGNLYGTTQSGGANEGEFGSRAGTVWKYHGATYKVLYNFCSQANCADGTSPAGVIMDGMGNLFGVTNNGGANNRGLVYELTP